jgi:cyclomaltodextrinase
VFGQAIIISAADGDLPPYRSVNITGTFNDWNPSDSNYRMTYTSNQVYQVKAFFKAGSYKFKFTINGDWTKHFGNGPDNTLAEPGTDIPLEVNRHGAYIIEVDLNQRQWRLQPSKLDAPQAIIQVRGPAEVNAPITLDGSESLAREGVEILEYEFGEVKNDTVQAKLTRDEKRPAKATVRLPQEGTYHFWLKVNDGMFSAPDVVTLKAESSYQIVGDWTATDPDDPVTFLRRESLGIFETILKSTGPGEHQLILVQNHDAGQLAGNLTVSVTQTNQQLWRLRYEEKSKRLSCEPANLIEFAYRPEDDPVLKDRVEVHTVNLAGSFNNWSTAATPMVDRGDGTYFAYLKLEDGLHQYKFVVNGSGWMQDPKADPALRVDDGHGGFNSGFYVGPRGEDYGPPPRGDINMAAVRHASNEPRYFDVIDNGLADVKLRTLHADATRVLLHVAGKQEREIPMRVSETAFGFDTWDASVTSTTTNQLSYYFVLSDGPTNRVYGAAEDTANPTGVKPFVAELKPVFATSDWAKHVVWYQIFPDRFRNGATENDPPHTVPWRWDWYKATAWERMVEGKQFSNDWYNRRLGGDFQGVIEKLPYFHEIGVTALYFCPVFEANSNHGYDTVDYRHISQYLGTKGDYPKIAGQETLDPATWQWTPSDKLFLEFVQKAHAQGLKVIVDGVFNHMGKGSFALRDVLTNGANSVYAGWFDVTSWGPPVKYKSWDGGGYMPNFRKDGAKGYAADSAKKYIFDITKRWMDPNGDGDPSDGVDGWRLDVAEDVPRPFWVDWHKHVKSINSNAYISGEVWGPAPSHLQGDEWDAVMNYQFAMRAIRYFVDQKRKISTTEFDRQLKELLAMYSMQVNMVMQNLYDSHDTDRLANMIINPDRDYDGCNRPQDGCPYNGAKPGNQAYRVLKLMATFQMTFLGAPMIWYGDEAGMFGADDPTDRKAMLWKDLEPYDNAQDAVMPDVLEHYRRVIAIRNSYRALRTGLLQTVLMDDANNLYGFTRSRGEEIVTVVLNNSSNDQVAVVPSPYPNDTRVVDILSASGEYYDAPMSSLGFPAFAKDAKVRAFRPAANAPAYTVRDGKISVSVPKKSAVILVRQ